MLPRWTNGESFDAILSADAGSLAHHPFRHRTSWGWWTRQREDDCHTLMMTRKWWLRAEVMAIVVMMMMMMMSFEVLRAWVDVKVILVKYVKALFYWHVFTWFATCSFGRWWPPFWHTVSVPTVFLETSTNIHIYMLNRLHVYTYASPCTYIDLFSAWQKLDRGLWIAIFFSNPQVVAQIIILVTAMHLDRMGGCSLNPFE